MSRSQMKYHSKIGYTYMPSAKLRAIGSSGGYLVRTNAAGFRSDHEFVRPRRGGVFRALLFGDSQTAGDGGANSARFGDRLEKAVPGLEIYNYGLSGSGPDQQFLAYKEYADVDHDLLVIALYVENIRRVTRPIVKSRDEIGNEAYYAKPYYLLENDVLSLHNVPVPKQAWTEQTLPAAYRSQVYSYTETNFFSRADRREQGNRTLQGSLMALAPLAALRLAAKNLAMSCSRFQPLPGYGAADGPEWLLLRKILQTWISASQAPVLLVTIPHYAYIVSANDPTDCQARFKELAADSGCHLYDPLSDLWKYPAKERRGFWSDASGHLSPSGHEVLARQLAPVFEKLIRSPT